MLPATYLNVLLQIRLSWSYCMPELSRTFHLVSRCQRSTQDIVVWENVASLQECFQLAENSRGMAVNYSPQRANKPNLFQVAENPGPGVEFPRRSSRRHYLEQPEEIFNCHVLQCPESSSFTTMANDSRFNYFSLFGTPTGPSEFVCVPEIGIFQVYLKPEDYPTASELCNKKSSGSLGHVVSEQRTSALSMVLRRARKTDGGLGLAFVGLNFVGGDRRTFRTSQGEDLNCFLYRAWAPGHPKDGQNCVTITTDATWITVDCERRLPYICEIFTSSSEVTPHESFCDLLP